MTPAEWQKVKDLYEEAVARPRAEQTAFAEQACDGEVRRELLRLLEFSSEDEARIDLPAAGGQFMQFLSADLFAALDPGQTLLGRFRILRLAGRGGMGEVYEAEDLQLRERVAIKTIRAQAGTDDRMLERFRREIALSRQVTHPNVCRMFEMHETTVAGRPLVFLTMEFLEGETLSEFLVREAPLSRQQAFPIIGQMVSALGAAHAAGVVHRDFKSSNVFLSKDRASELRVVVTDFGLARSLAGEGQQTSTGWGAGTPAYMAPEQLEGHPAGPAADQYALGVVMYEMATGQAPYPGDSPMQVAVRKVKEPPASPRTLNPSIDPKWEATIMRCLERDPRDRYAAAEDVTPSLQNRSFPRIPRRAVRRWSWAAAAVAVCVAAGFWLARSSRQGVEPPAAVASWYREGVAALHEGSLATAQRAFQKTVEGAPQWPFGYARLAQVSDEMDQPDRARQAILKAIQYKPSWFRETGLIDAVQALIARDFRAAEKAFRAGMGDDPGGRSGEAIDLARCLDRADRPREALRVLDGILRVQPDHPAANLNYALLGIRGSAKAEAVDAGFARALHGFEPLNRIESVAETQLQLALWHYKQQKMAEAQQMGRTSLQTARLAKSPWTEIRALFHLARVIREAGGAPEEFEPLSAQGVTLGRQERFWGPLLNGQIDLGILSFSQGELETALQQFTEVQRSAQESESPRAAARASYWLGRALLGKGRVAEAEQTLEKARAFWRANGFERERLRTELSLAEAWQKSGRDAEAMAIAEAALRQVREFGDDDLLAAAYYRQANYLMVRGRYPRALELWKELAVESQRSGFVYDEFTARLQTARALLNLGRFDEAWSAMRELEKDARFQTTARQLERWNLEAGLHLEQGHPAEALVLYRKIQTMAEEKKITRWKVRMAQALCIASTQGEPPAVARQACAPLFEKTDDRLAAAAGDFMLADLLLAEGKWAESRRLAEEARQFYAKISHHDNMLYALLIRGQAERRSGQRAELAATVAEAEKVYGTIRREWGDQAAQQYLQRPLYQQRWAEIHRQD